MKNAGVLVGTAAMLAGMFVLGMIAYQSSLGQERAPAAAKSGASLIRFHSPSTGAGAAKVTIVEFLDPACEACRAFHPIVKSILAANPGRVRLVVRYAPFHKDSAVVVRILEASKMQGLYWETLDAAFKSQPLWADHRNPRVELIWEHLRAVGLDIDKARRDMKDAGIDAILKQDVADLVALNVERTPTFFVNGKPLPVFSEGSLRAMVLQEVRANYP